MSGTITASVVGFGLHGDAFRLVSVGWGFPERNFTWTVGEESLIFLERPQEEGEYRLQVTAWPFVVPGRLPAQRVHVLVNGQYVGKDYRRHVGTFELPIGWELIRERPHIALTFLLPDAARPSDLGAGTDGRRLGLAISAIRLLRVRGGMRGAPRQAAAPEPAPAAAFVVPAPTITATMPTPMPFLKEPAFVVTAGAIASRTEGRLAAEQMLEFESIGTDAEFGLVQRRAGAEPLALLRFAEAPFEQIVAGLDAGFAGLGEAGTVDIRLRGREFVVTDSRYGLVWHSWTYEGETNPREVLERETRRLAFLHSKLLEDLAMGHKLLVFKRATPLAPDEIDRLTAAIGRYGSSHLLLVQEADATHAEGSVERVRPGLMRGYVARFAPDAAPEDVATDSWMAMARTAHELWLDDQAPR